jgi:hypothetical protein
MNIIYAFKVTKTVISTPAVVVLDENGNQAKGTDFAWLCVSMFKHCFQKRSREYSAFFFLIVLVLVEFD